VTTLTSAPLADVLDQLLADAATTTEAFRQKMARMSPDELAAWRASADDYRQLYAAASDIHLAISRTTAQLLYMLARARGARTIVEFGTSLGVSTLVLAAAIKDNNGTTLIGTEFVHEKVMRVRQTLAAAGVDDIVEIREGDALETLAHEMPDTIDLVFLDGAKNLYGSVLDLLEPRLAPGAVIVADNADGSPTYLDRVRTSSTYMSLRLHEEVELTIKV
jgi:predicted O-methyltransferase YrrM